MSLLLLFRQQLGVGDLPDALAVSVLYGTKGGPQPVAAGPGVLVSTKAGFAAVGIPPKTTPKPLPNAVVGSKGGLIPVPAGLPTFVSTKAGFAPINKYAPIQYAGLPAPIVQPASLPLLLGAYLTTPAPAIRKTPPSLPPGPTPFWQGIISAIAPVATCSISGTAIDTEGTLTATTPDVTSSIVGEHGVSATISATTPVATATIIGGQGAAGAISATTPDASAAIAGALGVAGMLSTTTPDAIASIVGELGVAGGITVTTPDATAAISGTVGAPTPPFIPGQSTAWFHVQRNATAAWVIALSPDAAALVQAPGASFSIARAPRAAWSLKQPPSATFEIGS